MTKLYDEVVKIKQIQQDWGKLDPSNKFHIAFMSAYRVDENFEFYDEEYGGWHRLCMMPTAVMMGDIPAEIVKMGKNKFHERKRKLRNKAVRRILNWNELKRWYNWNWDWSKDHVSISEGYYNYFFKGKYKVANKEINEFLGGRQLKIDWYGRARSREYKKKLKMERRRYKKNKAD